MSGAPPDGRCTAHVGTSGLSVGRLRAYLRISMRLQTDRRAMTVLLAHELHHAIEVASHPEVVNQKSMATLYNQIGQRQSA